MSFTQTVVNVKQADGSSVPMIAYTDGTNLTFAHAGLDATGAIISPATSGNQTTAISALSTIATQTAGLATAAAQATGNTSTAAIATNTGDLDANLGAKADAAASGDTGSFSLISLFKRLLTTSTAISTACQAAIPAGANVIGGVTVSDGGSAALGAKADAAASSDTGTFGLIALFKRSLQSLTSILAACQAATPAGTNLIGRIGIDQTTPGVTNLIYLPAPFIVAGATTTRPANTTAYAAGQLLANSTSAGSVTFPVIAAARANDMAGTILRLRLKKTGTTITQGIFRVHLYNSQPSVTNGDGAAWLTTSAGYLGAFDVTMTQAFSDGAIGIGTPVSGSGVAFTPAAGTQNLYYLIEARAAYVPVSGEVFTPYVEVQ
ncbi:hypothetical protein [Zavarzinella formosa]|uniref:hypothetical protein n=1 Tax=Zavarzinella formosa TaxID=360055 RepID=UPI0002F694E6|nr:hypothetical protein [Zavarzinella formosa]